MHKEHAHMSEEDFRITINACAPLITSYINTLCDNPDSLFKQEKIFTTLLNYADHVAEETQKVSLQQRRFNNITDTAIFERDKYVRPWIAVSKQMPNMSS